jgi:general secretion pathway protein J
VSLDSGLHAASTRHQGLELALLVIEQDLRAAVPRGVRDELGSTEPALHAGLGGVLLSLTRAVADVPVITRGAALTRVRYRLVDGALYRDVWAQLDRTPATEYRSRRLIEDVSAFELRFFGDASWSEFWPRADSGPATDRLPRGIEIGIAFGDGRTLRRVVARAG